MHPFGPVWERLIHICSSTQALADCLGLCQSTFPRLNPLAGICNLVAVPAREGAPEIENRNSSPAIRCRTAEPYAPPPVVARNPFEHDWILLSPPFCAGNQTLVRQYDPVLCDCSRDRCNQLAVPFPILREGSTRLKHPVSMQPPHIKSGAMFGLFLRLTDPSAPASKSAHRQFPPFTEIIRQNSRSAPLLRGVGTVLHMILALALPTLDRGGVGATVPASACCEVVSLGFRHSRLLNGA